ncbi:MAG: alpha/beta hydrolase [Xanthomonadales bacterium]|nr:alpha/beta hydrolase [Xanthomonadales bacterium]
MKMSEWVTASESQGLDPEIRQFAEALAAGYAAHETDTPISIESRRAIAEAVRRPWVEGGPKMADVREHAVPDGNSTIRVRIYRPQDAGFGPALIYLHGGGWTIFSLDTHDRLMREYADRAGLAVIGVDFSLAPESRFPTQLEECEAVLRWIGSQGATLGVSADRLAIGGDSAGANMALATCLHMREREPGLMPSAMLLNYGAYDAGLIVAEEEPEHPDFTLTRAEMKEFWLNYLRDPADRFDPLANPAIADLSGLPPALMIIAECDILLQENLRLARRMKDAGVAVEATVYPGATHSFLEAVSIARISDEALSHSAAWLAARLSQPG